MTLTLPRMVGAFGGFLLKHGREPTAMIVPAEGWAGYMRDPNSPAHDSSKPVHRVLLRRIRLIPVPREMYVAIDDHGKWFDYGVEEFPEDMWEAAHRALGDDVAGAKAEQAGMPIQPPIANSYVVPGTRLAAGEYPGSPSKTPPHEAEGKLEAFLDAGISAFIDLTDPADGLAPYEPMLREVASRRGVSVAYERLTMRDMDICEPSFMRTVLDTINARLEEGHGVYVHCWGGIGRTGMAVGCWLVRRGATGEEALAQVKALFHTMSPAKVKRHASWGSPQTEPQRTMVRTWSSVD